MHYRDPVTEVLERNRRIETRVVRIMEHLGIDVIVQRPTWNDGVIQIPSKHCTLRDILAVVPEGWSRAIVVKQNDDEILTLRLER